MLRGIATVNIYADDLAAAKQWYADLLGIEAYFEVPGGYAEFRVGDYEHELGIIDSKFRPASAAAGPGGAIVHWHVDDLTGTLERLLAMGATPHEPVTERGEGFVTASVIDPFDNILGIMTNPHYLEILRSGPVSAPDAPG